jgi:hypothetical protein
MRVCGVDLKRMCSLLILFSLFLILISFHLNSAACAESATSSSSCIDIQIEHVDQVVQILDGGSVIINDTVRVSPKPGRTSVTLEKFSIGFPYELNNKEISDNLDYSFAYSSSHPNARVDVALDAGLGRIGFYGIDVIFQDSITMNEGASCNFTVVFVFSNFISSREATFFDPEVRENVTETWFDLNFPLYPSLTKNASVCNVTLVLPSGGHHLPHGLNLSQTAYSKTSSHDFNRTSTEPHEILSHLTSPFPEFANEPAWVTFVSADDFLVVDVREIRRDIMLDGWGNIVISDSYHITNKADRDLSIMRIRLAEDAYGPPSAWDDSGDLNVNFKERIATITLRNTLKKEETAEFTLSYGLPWEDYVSQANWRNFDLAFAFSKQYNWTIRKLAVAITLPEGGCFQHSKPIDPHGFEKSGLQQTMTFHFFDVTVFHDIDFVITYEYITFWASFRPTLWVGLLVTTVCVIAFLWRAAPKPLPVRVIPVLPEALRSFGDTYERKMSAIRELEMVEQQVRKRKISRRRYKVRKKALEGRLSLLSKDLVNLKEEIRKAGSRYANIVRQIEVAETELEETEVAIRRIKLRYRRKEISKGTYRNLLDEYNRRKERAETTIEGALLRLREEIR